MAAAAQTRTEELQYLGSPTPGGLVARIQCFHHHSPGCFPVREGWLLSLFFLVAQRIKHLPAMRETRVQPLG